VKAAKAGVALLATRIEYLGPSTDHSVCAAPVSLHHGDKLIIHQKR
jgi:hypothetical protein